jgi:hypothetical protein
VTTIHIPDSMADAIKSLTGISALLTAKEWERAALVYAFTDPGSGQGRRQPLTKTRERLSIIEFARVGIAGLKTQDTVAMYRNAWQSAIDDGRAQPVSPGDDIELPTLTWPPTGHGHGIADKVAVTASPAHKAEAIRDLLRDPEVARFVAHDPEIARSVSWARARAEEPREIETRTQPTPDYRANLMRGVGLVIDVIRAIQTNDYEPSTSEAMLLHSLGLLISQAKPETEPDADLFAEIDRYLKEGSAL